MIAALARADIDLQRHVHNNRLYVSGNEYVVQEGEEIMRYMTLLFLIPLLSFADLPLFKEPVIIQADGVILDIGVISDPFMIDWDGDGLNDLLVGQFYPGKVCFYKNIGTSGNPVFTFSNYLQADGVDIAVSAG